MTTIRHRNAILTCAALAMLFGALSLGPMWLWKCATMDEPLHATAGYLHRFHGDFRINPEDPPLWKYWAALPHGRQAIRVDLSDPNFVNAVGDTERQGLFCVTTLFLTPANEGTRFIDRSRGMMMPIGLALAVLVTAWAWRLAGPWAGLVAATLYCLDPNFIAHASLVKNDVAISLLFLAVAMAAWSVGRRARWWNVLLLGLLCGAAVSSKFSGLLVGPIVVLLMLIRALLTQPWIVLKRQLDSRLARLAASFAIIITSAAISITMIWASYGFRFAPTPDPNLRLNFYTQVVHAKIHAFYAKHGRYGSEQEVSSFPTPLPVRLAAWAERNELLPQAYLYGFGYTYKASMMRGAYLLGQYSPTGWWYYFPLAMLFKTPLATLAAFAIALAYAFSSIPRSKKARGSAAGPVLDRWSLSCLLVPLALYALSALTTNLNLGLRHVLPLYPFLYILVAISTVRLMARFGKRAVTGFTILAVALAVETLASFPNYIPFFNAIAKPYRLHLLSDSNLDWGQDLPLLGAWQRENPREVLYLAYFGSVPPEEYGINYIGMAGGYFLREHWEWPEQPGATIAISATLLQGTHFPQSLRFYYGQLRQREPKEILGGSIYLYDVPMPPLERPTAESLERAKQPQEQ